MQSSNLNAFRLLKEFLQLEASLLYKKKSLKIIFAMLFNQLFKYINQPPFASHFIILIINLFNICSTHFPQSLLPRSQKPPPASRRFAPQLSTMQTLIPEIFTFPVCSGRIMTSNDHLDSKHSRLISISEFKM